MSNQRIAENVFRSKVEQSYYLILSALKDCGEPAGSWVLKEKLDASGIAASTATIGRYLKDMDAKRWTRQIGNSGRVITKEGLVHLLGVETKLSRARMHATTTQAMTAVRYDELVDLYVARRSLEIESARIAAKTATEADIARLTYSIMRYRQCVKENLSFTEPALNFHLILAESTHNKFIFAVLNLLIYEQKNIEGQFETLETREYALEYAQCHEDIVMAMSKKDGELAARLMSAHMDEMITVLEGKIKELKNQKAKDA